MHTISDYNNSGIIIATPEADLPADRQALNSNFKALAAIAADYVPYSGATADLDMGSHSVACGSIVVNTNSASPWTLNLELSTCTNTAIILNDVIGTGAQLTSP